MNLARRLLDRINAWELARLDRHLDESGWPNCIVPSCEKRAFWTVVGESGQLYCFEHRDASGKRTVNFAEP